MAGLTKQLGDSLKPIPIGAGLLVYLDQSKRLEFLKQWQQSIKR
jgi:iron(III) transport system substrate-binding protein